MKFNLKEDVESGMKEYPSLHLSNKDGKLIVQGIFTAHKGKIEIEDYELEISFPPKYPYDLPTVIETNEKIPRTVVRHVFSDTNSLCFGNPQDVFRVCKNGITFTFFLEKILNPHLCREYVREIQKSYPTGERSHANKGNEGIWEGYYEIFNTYDKSWILNELYQMLSHTLYAKNQQCYCNSGKKYKRCHLLKEPCVFDIGRPNVRKLHAILQKDYQVNLNNE